MGSVLRSFGAFQGNIWSVAPFIPVGPGENQCCPHKTRIFSKSPNGLIFKFFLVVHNIVSDIIHSKICPNNFFPYVRILSRCALWREMFETCDLNCLKLKIHICKIFVMCICQFIHIFWNRNIYLSTCLNAEGMSSKSFPRQSTLNATWSSWWSWPCWWWSRWW